jgi:hypothetical protein
MDELLSSLKPKQLKYIETQLANEAAGSDKQLYAAFLEAGLSAKQAKRALSYRDQYLSNSYLDGDTPIRTGKEGVPLAKRLGKATWAAQVARNLSLLKGAKSAGSQKKKGKKTPRA